MFSCLSLQPQINEKGDSWSCNDNIIDEKRETSTTTWKLSIDLLKNSLHLKHIHTLKN